jgi:hypothetical protein
MMEVMDSEVTDKLIRKEARNIRKIESIAKWLQIPDLTAINSCARSQFPAYL